ncbi:uncharacterized protein TNCT_586061 [Trichonephila clavata]|uniref:Uncharacterized protein n=1 Tax=Trichonephila clavata TaxID=2740835 RepID=A0A8X6KUA8_TRICU|nr:uncharacterized protein TNCT_586061 [Trichonephila clavata]
MEILNRSKGTLKDKISRIQNFIESANEETDAVETKVKLKKVIVLQKNIEELRSSYYAIPNVKEAKLSAIDEELNLLEERLEKLEVFRITAWIRRFINNVKLKKEDRIKTPLAAEEIEEAEEIWIKKVKAENFGSEINCLEGEKNLQKYSKIRNLNPFLNEKDILRISGRLQQSTLSYHEKHPNF